MELKINYQYTYFIHPFIVKEGKYQKYILKLLKNRNCYLRRFEKEKDLKLYQYFTPKVREFLFSSFCFTNAKYAKFEALPIETKAAVLAKNSCTIFEYRLEKSPQGKTGDAKGIFFQIQKIEIVCFSSGICFLCMKTNMEDGQSFENLLNFNYKFRETYQENSQLNGYNQIRIQTDSFSNASQFTEWMKEITGSPIEATKLNLNPETFLTYSYVCIDQEAWNQNKPFETIEHQFIKYANILPADNVANLKKGEMLSFSNWKYATMAMTKQGVTLMASSYDMNNYTLLPSEYENAYLYTYLFVLYQRIYLKKLSSELKQKINMQKARKKFVAFTKDLWIMDVTENQNGTLLSQKLKDVLELNQLYDKVKGEYELYYKELRIDENRRVTMVMAVILVSSLLFNILNFIMLSKES